MKQTLIAAVVAIASSNFALAQEFPRSVEHENGNVTLHLPQIEQWENYELAEGRLVVEVRLGDDTESVAGVAEFIAETDINLEERMIAVDNVVITATSFPEPDETRRQAMDALVRQVVQPSTQFVPLDVVLTYIAPDVTVADTEGLSFEPPPIFYSDSPAILVMTDGEPLLAPMGETRLQYVVNTNWDLFRYKEKEWYLRNGTRWLKSKELTGPWKFDQSLPGDFKKIPDDENWAAVKAAIPPAKGSKDVPVVFYSDRPAEMIVTDGGATYATVGSAGLEYIFDTESDVFRWEGRHYYLVSGRWFRSASLRGPWKHVGELPAVFASIPEDHQKGHVLAAVPDSDEARLAVLEASIPRKATVLRTAGANVVVYYQGEPVFEQIPGTQVERATNSASDVLRFRGTYYLCLDAVWYRSDSANGPWEVADEVPDAIYAIPPSSPSYHVTNVYVYESDEDSVSTGYTSGYFGVSVAFGIAMYGTGWYYPPYWGYHPHYNYHPHYPYPWYYPYPYSYGASSWYNPHTGMYGRSRSVYGPYGGYGRGASYNPETGAYARGAAVWDSNEIAGRGIAYNPRTSTAIATHRYVNEDGGWGESLITHNDRWLQTRSEWNDYGRRTEFETGGGGSGQARRGQAGGGIGFESGDGTRSGIGRSNDGDLYAGRDGNVYRRDEDGWHRRGEDGWSKVEVPDERAQQIDQMRGNAADARGNIDRDAAREQVRSSERMQSLDPSTMTQRRQEAQRRPGTTYDTSRTREPFDSRRQGELDRSRSSRDRGYQRHEQRRSTGGTNRRQRAPARRPRR